eukprot:8224358-Pyramimonas_sp.AAC.1
MSAHPLHITRLVAPYEIPRKTTAIGNSIEGPSDNARIGDPTNFGTSLTFVVATYEGSIENLGGSARMATSPHFGTPFTRFVA